MLQIGFVTGSPLDVCRESHAKAHGEHEPIRIISKEVEHLACCDLPCCCFITNKYIFNIRLSAGLAESATSTRR